ncbi:MAG TPA: YdcH family protein [Thermohalobaculum sp.]|nr:YdcH family protein [Thermohalobaculum sp.]
MNVMNEDELLRARLKELRRQHRALDQEIRELAESPVEDQLRLRRLKKQKLHLKDEIARVEDKLYPDIIA